MDLADEGDGGGWVIGPDSQRRWGLFGAAGLLLRAPSPDDPADPLVLLQHRAKWTASGDTWALPGGAIDSGETPAEAAARETFEEAGIPVGAVRVRGERVTSRMSGVPRPRTRIGALRHDGSLPGGMSRSHSIEWTYTTVFADVPEPLDTIANYESVELRWVRQSEVEGFNLMPAFAEAWPSLRARPVSCVVDVANVLGSRSNGWWRDRAGYTSALLGDLAGAVPCALAPGAMSGGGTSAGLGSASAGDQPTSDAGGTWLARTTVVVEGAAKKAESPASLVRVDAPGEGDDTIVDVASAELATAGPGNVLVVTSDRGLRNRLPAGISVLGSGGFLSRLGLK